MKILKSRFRILLPLFTIFFALSFLTRTVLLAKAWHFLPLTPWLLIKIFGVGLFYDAITLVYFIVPFVLYVTVIPEKIFWSRFHKPLIYLVSFLSIDLLVFDGVAEYYFFDEFSTRFNFIAIDYLLYTKELANNAMESYPFFSLMSGVGVISLMLLLWFKKWVDQAETFPTPLKQRVKYGLLFLLLPLGPLLWVDLSFTKVSSNSFANELAANGIYNIVAAFKNNQIDYETFYASREELAVFQDLRTLLAEKHSTFVHEDPPDLTRAIKHPGPEKRLNIALIVVESLSAEYLGCLGDTRHLTPNLDQLATESLFFTNLHATGTRTDRGLESITLSIPPTPGRSLVKRPNNEHLFSWGFLMKERGYDTKFIYSGYGYFDNMNYFFSRNGFKTLDRKNFSKNEITFENAWGVCDEDLFNKAIKEFDEAFRRKIPFFCLLMTTSNHRPFTYPEGKVDIPSGTGRRGAVKYTDYAIGKFIREAKERPWFKDTLFVIVADHCANSAGKTSLPPKRYEIPLFIYSPAYLRPQAIDKLASQIDLAPTVLGLLNFSYQSKFFGKDILNMEPDQERALIGTYQKLGLLKGEKLAVLDIKKEKTLYRFDRRTGETKKVPLNPKLLDEAISYYQGADYLHRHHLDQWNFGDKRQIKARR